MDKSRVIFIEGVDGSGKTTLITKLKEKYKNENVEFLTPFSFEDGGKEKLVSVVESGDLEKEIHYLVNLHKNFKEVLNKRLDTRKETLFIVDRSVMSFLAYQLLEYKYGNSDINTEATPDERDFLIDFLIGSVTDYAFEASFIYLDVKKEILLSRLEERKGNDALDARSVHKYESLLRNYRESFFYLNGPSKHLYKKRNNTIDDMNKIIEFVNQKIESQRPILKKGDKTHVKN